MKILRKRIIQFGMIRSGSTLIYNILKELFPDRRISKTHKYRKNWKDAFLKVPIVATYRDPLDIICSSIKTHDDLANREIIKNHIKLLKVNGLEDFVKLDKTVENEMVDVIHLNDENDTIEDNDTHEDIEQEESEESGEEGDDEESRRSS